MDVKYGVTRLTALEACETVFRLLEPGNFAIDAGANQGIVTSAMVDRVGSTGKVWAIEMLPSTFNKLKTNSHAWKSSKNLKLINSALSDCNGTINIGLSDDFTRNSGVAYASHSAIHSSHKSYDVICKRLDHILDNKIPITDKTATCVTPIVTNPLISWVMQSITCSLSCHLISKLLKLDVERHEYQALVGAGCLITDQIIQHIIFEDCSFKDSQAKQHLVMAGYTIYKIKPKLHKPFIQAWSSKEISNTASNDDYCDFIATVNPSYIKSKFNSNGYKCLSYKMGAKS